MLRVPAPLVQLPRAFFRFWRVDDHQQVIKNFRRGVGCLEPAAANCSSSLAFRTARTLSGPGIPTWMPTRPLVRMRAGQSASRLTS